MTTRISSRLLAVFLLLFLFAAHALAEEAADGDPIVLLQRARVAQDVEKDLKKAIGLYEQVWKKAPGDEAGMRAGLRLASLLSDDKARLEIYKTLTTLHTSRLPKADARVVHDAMSGLLSPGESAKTPLGTVFVRGEEPLEVSGSPIERKLATIFRVHQVQVLPLRPDAKAKLRDLDRELRDLGDAAMPVLLRYVEEGEADEAFNAAVMLGRTDPKATIRGYVRATRLGRAEFRNRVVIALGKIPPSKETSPYFVAQVMPLLGVEDIEDVHSNLIHVIAPHLSDKALQAQVAQAGPRITDWFRETLSRLMVTGVPAAVAAYQKSADQELLGYIANAVGAKRYELWTIPLKDLPAATIRDVFYTLLDGEIRSWGRQNYRRVLTLIAAGSFREDVVGDLWRRAQSAATDRERQVAVRVLSEARQVMSVDPDPALYETDAALAQLFHEIPSVYRNSSGMPRWMYRNVELARRAARLFRDATPAERKRLRPAVDRILQPKDVYETLAPMCLELFQSTDYASLSRMPKWMWLGAAKTADPSFLTRLAELKDGNVEEAVLVYGNAGGTGIAEFAARQLTGGPNHRITRWALEQLVKTADAESHTKLDEILRDPEHELFRAALYALNVRIPAQRAMLVRVYEQAASAQNPAWWVPAAKPLRMTLVYKAASNRMREAIPFLVRMYETEEFVKDKKLDERQKVVDALDGIRADHERLTFFKRWAEQGESDDQAVVERLHDEDVAIRRAAVLAFAALKGRSALARLLQIAKADKDPGVRDAALKAIEHIALMPNPAEPVGAQPTPKK